MPRRTTAPTSRGSSGLAERIAFAALLAVPVLVPIALSKPPFTTAPPLTLSVSVYPKLFAFAVAVGVALVAWATGFLSGEIPLRSVPLVRWLAALLGLSAVAAAFGLHPITAVFGSSYQAVGLLVLVLGGALLFVVVQLVNTPDRIRGFSWATVAGGTIVAVVGLLQQVGADPLRLGLEYHYGWERVGSLLGNSDFAGSYLVVPLVVAAALALAEKDAAARAVVSACFALMLLCMLATGTRGAWIGAVVGLAALGVASVRIAGKVTKSLYVPAGIAAGVPLVWALANAKDLMVRFADMTQASELGGGRIVVWLDSLKLIAARPLFGTGPDTYRLGWHGVRSLAWVRATGAGFAVDDPHNLILLFGATLGIPATIAAVGLVVGAVVTSRGFALERDEGAGRRVFAGWWAALIGVAATLLFTVNTVVMVAIVFSCVGIVITVRSAPAEPSAALRRALAAAAVVLGIASIGVGTASLAADALLVKAQRSPDRLAIAEQAAAIAPWNGDARYLAVVTRAVAAEAALGAGQQGAAEQARAADAAFEQLVAFNPREPQYQVARANFLGNSAQYLGPDALSRAVVAGKAALALSPLNPKAAYITALAQLRSGDGPGAVATLEPVWQADPTYIDPGVIYVQALDAVGNRAGALGVLATLQQRFPGDPRLARLEDRLKTPAPGQ